LGALFVGGGALFWAFEYTGPAVLLAAVPVTWIWALASGRRGVYDKGVTHA
jgi:hypothetical protein